MKKTIATILILIMCLTSVMLMAGCSQKEPYSDYDLTEYITLPDYDSFTTSVPEVVITDDDISEEMESILESYATSEDVTEGTVEEGDTVKISFKGTLADGTTADGMSSDEYSLTLGSGSMIDGFEEGLYGAAIGDTVTLDLTFPDPYQNNTDLSGKDVTFEVTVLSKTVENVPELTDQFVAENYEDYSTVEELRAAVADSLEQDEYETQLREIKQELYNQIVSETEVIKYPEKELSDTIDEVDNSYKQMAESNGSDWEDYRDNTLGVTQDEYEEEIELYAQEMVKQQMVIRLIGQNEDITVTDEEFDEYMNNLLTSYGFEDADDFENYTGMSLDEYVDAYMLDLDYLLTKELDTIYDRLVDNGNISSEAE